MEQQHVVIATPSYDGAIHDLCAGSVAEARIECIKNKILPTWITMSGSPYVEVLRNKLVRDFLAIESATDLVFVDSDVGFDPAALPRLLSYDADVVGGCYPFKSDTGGFPVMIDWETEGVPRIDEATGLPHCLMIPTGFLRIRRRVFERILHYFGADKLTIVEREPDGAERERYRQFFRTEKIGEQWFGEDVHFCKLWREMGGAILLDPDIDFTHSGRKHWRGNYHEYRRRLPGGDLHEAEPQSKIGAALFSVAEQAKETLKQMDVLDAIESGRVPAPSLDDLPTNEFQNLYEEQERAKPKWEPGPELLLGCGHSRFKVLIPPGGSPEWHELTTLDRNPDVKPDVEWNMDWEEGFPFKENKFTEIHAYEVLEHLGAQGNWKAFFDLFDNLWGILRPGGYLLGSVPAWDSEAAWGDPSHRRVLPPMAFAMLSQEEYRKQVGITMMSDFRFAYKADFRIVHLKMDEVQYKVDQNTGIVRKIEPKEGRFTKFILQAIKPSTYSAADIEQAARNLAAREADYGNRIARWKDDQGGAA